MPCSYIRKCGTTFLYVYPFGLMLTAMICTFITWWTFVILFMEEIAFQSLMCETTPVLELKLGSVNHRFLNHNHHRFHPITEPRMHLSIMSWIQLVHQPLVIKTTHIPLIYTSVTIMLMTTVPSSTTSKDPILERLLQSIHSYHHPNYSPLQVLRLPTEILPTIWYWELQNPYPLLAKERPDWTLLSQCQDTM